MFVADCHEHIAAHSTVKPLRKLLLKETFFCRVNLLHNMIILAKSSLPAGDIFFQELRHILHHHSNLQLQLGEMFSFGK